MGFGPCVGYCHKASGCRKPKRKSDFKGLKITKHRELCSCGAGVSSEGPTILVVSWSTFEDYTLCAFVFRTRWMWNGLGSDVVTAIAIALAMQPPLIGCLFFLAAVKTMTKSAWRCLPFRRFGRLKLPCRFLVSTGNPVCITESTSVSPCSLGAPLEALLFYYYCFSALRLNTDFKVGSNEALVLRNLHRWKGHKIIVP